MNLTYCDDASLGIVQQLQAPAAGLNSMFLLKEIQNDLQHACFTRL